MNRTASYSDRYRDREPEYPFISLFVGIGAVTLLFLSTSVSYMLFHCLAEMFSIVIGFGIFALAWNTRRFMGNDCLKVMGIGYACSAILDLLHTFAYKDLNVFPGFPAQLTPQFWIAARYMQAAALLAAPFFLKRRIDSRLLLLICGATATAFAASILSGHFPDCLGEAQRLTSFKIYSEYVIIGFCAVSLLIFYRNRHLIHPRVFTFIAASLACTMVAELAFTAFTTMYDYVHMFGHLLKIAAFYLIYRALLVTGLSAPFDLIFRELTEKEQTLRDHQDTLEKLIMERTVSLETTNRALTLREQEYHTLLDTIPDLIVRYDTELRRTYVNPAWEQASGLSWNEVVNVPVPSIPRVSHPIVPEYEQKLRRVLTSGTTETCGFFWKNALGTELFLEYVIVPEHDRSGGIAGALAIGRDLSERRRAEEALQKSEALLNAAQRLAKVGGWEFDVISGKSFWTEELYRIHEMPNDPGIDHIKESLACYGPEDRQIIHDAFQRACEQGESYDLEFPFTTYTGKPLWIRTTVQPVHEEGKVVRLVGNLMDITERKRAEQVTQARLRVLETVYTADMSLDETLRVMLDEIEAHTGSRIGFYHFLEEDQQTLSLQNWSTSTLTAMCTAEGKGSHYPVAEAGVWADCVRQRRPVIHNSYATLPNRRGMPDGHAEVTRELIVPVFRGPLIVAIIGVGNKPEEYTETDVQIASLLGDFSWEIVIRKRAEESLRQSEEAVRMRENMLNESQRVGQVGGWDWDAVNDIIWWSDEYYRIYGFKPGTPPPNYLDHLQAYTPESAERLDAAVKRAMESGESYELDLELATPTPVTRWIVARCEVKLDESGAIAGLRGTSHNITERKRAEEALRLQAIELEQEVAERQVAQETLQEQAILLENEIEEHRNAQDELEKLNESLEQRVGERTADLEQANIRLQELDRMKSMFIASMSHELRTPLNSVIGFSRILLSEWAGPLNDGQKDNLATILRSGNHLLSLINDVIDVSKIEAGMIEVSLEDFDLYDVVSEAEMSFENDISDKGVDLKVQAIHHSMHSDRTRLLQCLLNLISNAVKYTEKGTITICAEIPNGGDMLELSVTDTGIGIKEEDLDKLFSPFVRLDSHLTSTVPGTGLGLYLTKKLVKEVLRGKITVKSTLGVGSRFVVTVPVNL